MARTMMRTKKRSNPLKRKGTSGKSRIARAAKVALVAKALGARKGARKRSRTKK
ncbi:MAG TPA: hypothetical protein VL326_29745 [Kofleriaceae bacterium]|jgi:hypothetical protein|nr:hypothetical protein [Kofleriaceae bacterium]